MGKQLALLGGALLVAGFAAMGAIAQEDPPLAVQATEPDAAREFDRLLAPIALYPDQLLAQILMAATYPLDVVRAERWLQNPTNAALRGDALATALAPLPWDPSVKSLVPFPRILAMMDANLDWTEQLGDTFLANPAAVMDSAQRLRKLALAAGKLQSGAQEAVATEGGNVTIAPAMPDVVYVPAYDPSTAYGEWPYPGYPPDYFPDYFSGISDDGFGYGWWGVPVIWPLWGWGHCDWGYHRIFVDSNRFAGLNGGHRPRGNGVWQHEPGHRSGVPHQDAGLHNGFGGAALPKVVRGYSGYPTGGPDQPRNAPLTGRQVAGSAVPQNFGSFGHGAQMRSPTQHSFSSRMSAPAQRASPSWMSAPANGAGGGMRALSGHR